MMHQRVIKIVFAVVFVMFLTSCGSYFNQPLDFQEARIGESSVATTRLQNLPKPKEPVVVGVYGFRDLTGQYKQTETGSTFSTAVTQGATSVLIKALEDSQWFTAIERENIGNLLNERNIIRSTRQEYSANTNQPQLPPLLYAGILLEGGIVSYDTNILTGGLGARYFGISGSAQYRQDRVTIYLRAISTSSGKILKNIYVSKSILSQAVDASLFRYVNFQRLLEVETGFTRNEPVQLAVTEAIEKAVEGIIIEGIEDDLWSAADWKLAEAAISKYNKEKEEAALEGLYQDKYITKSSKTSLGIAGGVSMLDGDYSGNDVGPMFRIEFTQGFSDHVALNIIGNGLQLKSNAAFSETYAGMDANLKYQLLPKDNFSPYLYAGIGFLSNIEKENFPNNIDDFHYKLQYGVGAELMLSPGLGLKVFAEHHIGLDDELDYVMQGKRDDHFFNFGVGVNFYLGQTSKKPNN